MSWRWSSSSSTSTCLCFQRLSLFLVSLLLFSILSFFVVDGVGENGENEGMLNEENTESDRLRTIGNENNSNDNGDGEPRDTSTATTVTRNSESESVDENYNPSPRNQNFTNNFNWHFHWDPDWEKEMAAGLASLGIISDGRLAATFLGRGVLGRFVFMNNNEGNWLSFTITPCTSVLQWSIKFLSVYDENQNFSLKESQTLRTFRTDQIVTYNETDCRRGFYTLEIRPVLSDTYVHFYVTTKPFEHLIGKSFHQMQSSSDYNSSTFSFVSSSPLVKRQPISVKKIRGGRFSINWKTSPLNPQLTQYCIVVNTRKDYSSLCGAQGERYGVLPPDLMHLPYYHYTYNKRLIGAAAADRNNNNTNNLSVITGQEENDLQIKSYSQTKTFDDIIIGCLDKRKNLILNDLQEGQLYYINIFVKNTMTNLSYPYVRTTLNYKLAKNEGKNILRDSKPLKVSLPKNGDNHTCTTLKFNLKNPCQDLIMYAMPCVGGSIIYQVFNGNRLVYQSNEVTSLDIIKLTNPRPGRYRIEVSEVTGNRSINRSRNNVASSKAEFLVSKMNKRFPLPRLPVIRKISEDISQRTCDSVTIEWWSSPGNRDTEYCIYLKKDNRPRSYKFKEPNQCDLERNLKNDRYITHSFCLQRIAVRNEKFRQRLTGLYQSTTYVLQLIVRRQKGMSLSYDLHHVATAGNC